MRPIFEIQNIPPEGVAVEGAADFTDLNLKLEGAKPAGPVDFRLSLKVISGEFLATGSLSLSVKLNCSRCLKEIDANILIEDFIVNEEVGNKKIIDLTDRIREDIIFALPLKPLCDKNCKGICPQCGKNLNVESCSCTNNNSDKHWGELGKLDLPPGK
jgi:uncharacterized protein